jgi:hypothetical protein
VYLFANGIIRIDMHNQRLPITEIQKFLRFVEIHVVDKVLDLLYQMAIPITKVPLDLQTNVRFENSEIELDVTTKNQLNEVLLSKLVQQASFLFSKAEALSGYEFMNVELKRIDNFRKTDNILRFIHKLVKQTRTIQTNDYDQIVKTVMGKYSLKEDDAKKRVSEWHNKFVDTKNKLAKNVKVYNNIGLEIVGSKTGNQNAVFTIKNIIKPSNIELSLSYLIATIHWSQDVANERILQAYLSGKSTEKIVERVEDQMEAEQEEETEFDINAYLGSDANSSNTSSQISEDIQQLDVRDTEPVEYEPVAEIPAAEEEEPEPPKKPERKPLRRRG